MNAREFLDTVDDRITQIAVISHGDEEKAHSMEDALLKEALEVIRDCGYAEVSSVIAKKVLAVTKLEFNRYCA